MSANKIEGSKFYISELMTKTVTPLGKKVILLPLENRFQEANALARYTINEIEIGLSGMGLGFFSGGTTQTNFSLVGMNRKVEDLETFSTFLTIGTGQNDISNIARIINAGGFNGYSTNLGFQAPYTMVNNYDIARLGDSKFRNGTRIIFACASVFKYAAIMLTGSVAGTMSGDGIITYSIKGYI